MDKVRSIEGIITLDDGSESKFLIGTDFGWSQWGADTRRLGKTGEVVDAMVDGFKDAEIPFVSDSDDYDDEEEPFTAEDLGHLSPIEIVNIYSGRDPDDDMYDDLATDVDWPKFDSIVGPAVEGAVAMHWDECHKIYLSMDLKTQEDMEENGYESHEPDLALLRMWYDQSCELRLVQSITHRNTGNPNDDFDQLISQFWDEDYDFSE